MASSKHPFQTDRLLYRAVETPDDDALFQNIQMDPYGFINSNTRVARPQSRKDAAAAQKSVSEDALIGVVICLQPTEPDGKPTAIGVMELKSLGPAMTQHRFTEISIDILPGYQGQGYGSEAVKWLLEWAFEVAGLHRVMIRAFEWNYGARNLYLKLGFKHEGTMREELWHKGRFWDGYCYGMLEREWRELYGDNLEH